MKAKMMMGALGICSVLTAVLFFVQVAGLAEEQDRGLFAEQRIQQAIDINQSLYESPSQLERIDIVIPSSLEGVDHASAFKMDAQNQLLISYSIREMIDSYLSALGEQDLEVIINNLQSEIVNSLDEPARSQALSLLKRYIDFKLALADFQPMRLPGESLDRVTADQLASAQAKLVEVREQFFDANEYESFFADEDAQTEYTIETLRISQNPDLSEAKKVRQIELASNLLPEAVRESRERVVKFANLREQVEALRSKGAHPEQIYQIREQQLGHGAAHALAELDQKRAQWQDKLDAFAKERNQVINSSLSYDDKDVEVERLLLAYFDQSELKRARALMQDGRLD